MRGFFGGMVWGLVFVLGIGTVVTLLSPVAPRPDVDAEPPAAGAGSTVAGDTGVKRPGTDGDLVEIAPAAPKGDAAHRDDLRSMEQADTRPSEQPRVGRATGALNDPTAAPEAAGVALQQDGDAPVAVTGPATAPAPPRGDAALSVSTQQPAQPALPDTAGDSSGFGATPAAPEIETSPAVTSTGGDRPPAADGQGAVVAAPGADAAPDPAVTQAAAPTDGLTGDGSERGEAGGEEDMPRMATLPQAGAGPGTTRPTIGTPVVPLTERGTAAQNGASQEPAPDDTAQDETSDLPPLERFAAPFDNPEARALMAIVLIDDADAIGIEALSAFPYPLTFAVDPAAPDAAEKMARHRAAGFEVVALVDLPAQATAADAEVALAAGFATLDEAVGVLEGPGSGIQGNRALSDQVAAFAGATGRGLITRDNGLNTVQKLALRDGVPSAVVFRDFDGAGQSPTVMRRFLDQAAFRAGQEGAVIMLGRIRPDTVSALLLWGLQDRAARVALAPVSAVLRDSVVPAE